MKIINLRGQLPPWWFQIEIACHKCRTVYQLEEGDTFEVYGQGDAVRSTCPHCSSLVNCEAPYVRNADAD